jgi:primosomal protein N' (replication factor Y)
MTGPAGARYVQVAVPRPIDRTFAYRVPEEWATRVAPGTRVVVPFGPRELVGWVDRIVDAPPRVDRVRDVLDVPDDGPILDPDLLDLCRWIARYYVAPLGLVLRAALPSALHSESAAVLAWTGPAEPEPDLPPRERELADFLRARRGPVRMGTVRRALGPGGWWSVARRLAARGRVRIEILPARTEPPVRVRRVVRLVRELPSLLERDRVFGRARRQRECYEWLESAGGRAELAHLTGSLGFGRAVIEALVAKGLAEIAEEPEDRDPFAEPVPPAPALEPTPPQREAIDTLLRMAERPEPGVAVLQGVTGSGKTLVYIEVLKELVGRRNRSAIVLVPEIALTPQTVARFRQAFGDRVAVLHSGLGEGERYDAWRALREGRKTIAIGARSAVFAPVRNLGAIVIDEEHEPTYKQNDPVPRYHAREVALVRAARAGALVCLGSATPSLETWARARSGRWTWIRLPARVGDRPLPPVRIVDLREERRRLDAEGGGGSSGPIVLSRPLEQALEDCLARGEQAILLLNRRGYASFLQCRACGFVKTCPNCSVSLTYHRRPEHLLCHHCAHTEIVPRACPECGADALAFGGVGTQHVERVLGERFPAARIARMDLDTTGRKWAHADILARVERGEVDILLGTQMIAKGLDFPRVTLVGVIHADVALHLPDFRASERTFQLLAQVAGRAGRGPLGGRVILQTALPDHYALRHAARHDYDGFAERELREREEPWYPPHCRLANLLFTSLDEREAADAALEAARWLRARIAGAEGGVRAVGPAPAPIPRIRNRYRWHVLLKAAAPAALGRVLREFARRPATSRRGVHVEIDRDPASLL